jgi:hypothetical protein
MSVLKREEYLNKIQNLLGDDSSDESIAMLEDLTDTYNDLEKRANGDGIDWKAKYEENDSAWKKRYTKRFFSGNGYSNSDDEEESEEDTELKRAQTITINDLFK